MPVRITDGPNGLKATVIGDDSAPADETFPTPLSFAEIRHLALVAQSNSGIQLPLKHPAPPLVWSPRRPFITGQTLRMDDSGFSILGNALLAAWWNGKHRDPARDEDLRREVSERTELRDLLEYEGVLDDAFAGPFRPDGDYAPESLGSVARRLEAAVNSNEWFAMVSVNVIDFTGLAQMPPDLAEALAAASPAERRTPIARLGPCRITRALRGLVIDCFRQGRVNSTPVVPAASGKGGPRSGAERARERAARGVLEAIYRDDPAARLTKAEALSVLAPHFSSGKAQERIWGEMDTPEWKVSGRPCGAIRRVSLDLVRVKVADALK